MLKLIRLTLVLTLTLAAAIGAVRLVGASQHSASFWQTMSTNPNGLACRNPCMFGVLPDITTPDVAFTIWQKYGWITNLFMSNSENKVGGSLSIDGQTASITLQDGWASLMIWPTSPSMSLDAPFSGTTLANVIDGLGVPDYVIVDQTGGLPALVYETKQIMVLFDVPPKLDSRVLVVDVPSTQAFARVRDESSIKIPWSGFAIDLRPSPQ